MQPTGTVTVRQARRQDAREVMLALTRACLDEPVLRWVIPDDSARQARVAAWARWADEWVGGMLGSGVLLVAGRGSATVAGLSQWQLVTADPAPPAHTPAQPEPPAHQAPDHGPEQPGSAAPHAEDPALIELVYGEYAPRMALVNELIHPRRPRSRAYWHLQQMVVVPEQRGHGLGGAMLRHQLDQADAAGIGTYLEASSPRSQALYERHGFRPHGEPIRLPDDGPVLQPMWRAAPTGT